MKVEITNYEKRYEFEMQAVAQLCGQNILVKSFMFDSIRKYFGTYRYSEDKNPWRDNVLIDGNIVGRKYFQLIDVSNREQIISLINLSKQSLLVHYLKNIITNFECEKELEIITGKLDLIFLHLNNQLKNIGPIELNYNVSNLWNMIQQSEICGKNEKDLNELDNYELLKTLLNVVEKLMDINPQNYLLLFQNIDHLIHQNEYQELYEILLNLHEQYNIHSILSTSLDGFVKINKEYLSDINIIGEESLTLPSFEKIKMCIENQYPINSKLTDEELIHYLIGCIQRLCRTNYLVSTEENIICKIINQSLGFNESIEIQRNQCCEAFLEA